MKNRERKSMEKNNGITLIALVITIIVLLILAGVTIATVTGENGILSKAREADEKTEKAEKDEKIDLAKIEDLINGYVDGIEVEQVTDQYPGKLEIDSTSENTYMINSIEDLVFFAYDVANGNNYEGKIVKLALSLDFNSDKSYVNPYRTDYAQYGYDGELKTLLTSKEGFIPIGMLSTSNENTFLGDFNGTNYSILNLYINRNIRNGIDYQSYGLFSRNDGTIKNINVSVDINFECDKNNIMIGAITGLNYGTIENCSATGDISIMGHQQNQYIAVGGISGQLQNTGTIKGCRNGCAINGKSEILYLGGIVGSNNGGNTLNSYNIGLLFAHGDNINMIRVGGICGSIDIRNSSVTNCSYNNQSILGIGGEVNNSPFTDETINDSTLTIEKILEILG